MKFPRILIEKEGHLDGHSNMRIKNLKTYDDENYI